MMGGRHGEIDHVRSKVSRFKGTIETDVQEARKKKSIVFPKN